LFNTHIHHDHVSNNSIFQESKKHINKIELTKRKERGFLPLSIDPEIPYQLTKGIELISTPGHTLGSTSVVVKNDGKTFIITGDSIPIKENFYKWIPPIVNIDPKKCLTSMEKIKNLADFIIPGHDILFEAKK